jgi:hypothetical protein
VKPLPAKGYCRAKFLIEQSAFDPEVRQLRLAGPREYISAFVRRGPKSRVCFSYWLRRNTDHTQRSELISILYSGRLGEIEVRLFPTAFPRIYGLINKKDTVAA